MEHKRLASLDGLRGIALILVMIFHLLPSQFGGGYVGVDLFFVISGFVLFGSLERAQGPIDFLWKRFVRLVPATLFLCLCLFALAPHLIERISHTIIKRVLEASFFITPFTDSQGPDYFQDGFFQDMLAHTWSLGVELHISIIFALGLLIWKFLPKLIKPLVIVLTGLSFVFFLLPVFSLTERYALTPFRLWGFLAGLSLAWYLKKERQTEDKHNAGLISLILNAPYTFALGGCLLIGALLLGHYGWFIEGAALATVSSLFLIAGNAPKLVSIWPLVKLGKLSYGVYLWHLPLLILISTIAGPMTFSLTLLWVSLSIAMGWLSWALIERPSILLGKKCPPTYILGASLLYTLIISLSALVALAVTPKGAEPQAKAFYECHMFTQGSSTPKCLEDDAKILLWADSHGGVLSGPASDWKDNSGEPISLITRNGCPPAGPSLVDSWIDFPGKEEEKSLCRETQDQGRAAAEIADTIILTAHWYRHTKDLDCSTDCAIFKDMKNLITSLQDKGKRVILIAPMPEPGWPVFFTSSLRTLFGNNLPTRPAQEIRDNAQNTYTWINTLNVEVIDPFDTLCPTDTCLGVDKEGGYIFYDKDHLTENGALKVFSQIISTLTKH